jgi:hypothetical protein
MESISIATFPAAFSDLFLFLRPCGLQATVMLNAPGVAVFPFDARTLVPKPKGPIALG